MYDIASQESPFSGGYNVWHFKAVMTQPDGSTKTVYSNHAGRDLLIDHDSSSGRWIHYNKYNAQGHLEWQVEPSAIDMSDPYDDGAADLDVKLHDDKGLIHVTTYYTSTGSGGAAGYPELQQVKRGSEGDDENDGLITISKTEYTSHSMGSGGTLSTIYPVQKRTVYRSDVDGGSEGVDTVYDYDSWIGSTNQPQQVTTELPNVGSTQNGGIWLENKTRVQVYDKLGRLVSSTDAREIETKYEYNDATDTLAKMTQDHGIGLGHLNIVTEYKSDSMGRTVETIGPEFHADGGLKRTVNWTKYLDSQHEIRSGQGYTYGEEDFAEVTPISITRLDLNGRVIDEIQATTTNTGSIPTGSIPQEDWTRWTHYHYNAQGRLESTRVYHDIPGSGDGSNGMHYNQTEFGYDAMGRQNKVKSPAGTITRTVYDPRGLVLSVWVGTNETGATPDNPGGSGSPNNMRPVTINTYDEQAYSEIDNSLDGLLTKVTSPVDTNSANDREVKFRYDWRDDRTRHSTIVLYNCHGRRHGRRRHSTLNTAPWTHVHGSQKVPKTPCRA